MDSVNGLLYNGGPGLSMYWPYVNYCTHIMLGGIRQQRINLILQPTIYWGKGNIKCYLSRRVIFIRSDLFQSQHNKKVSVIFILGKISFAYSKQKMGLSGGLKFSLEIIESHYRVSTMKLL